MTTDTERQADETGFCAGCADKGMAGLHYCEGGGCKCDDCDRAEPRTVTMATACRECGAGATFEVLQSVDAGEVEELRAYVQVLERQLAEASAPSPAGSGPGMPFDEHVEVIAAFLRLKAPEYPGSLERMVMMALRDGLSRIEPPRTPDRPRKGARR